jgi:hypothetical protein
MDLLLPGIRNVAARNMRQGKRARIVTWNGATALKCQNEVRYMLIRIGYDIAHGLPNPATIVFLPRVHPSRKSILITAEDFRIEPELEVENYLDVFGNRFGRVNAPAGTIRFLNRAVVHDSGEPDAYAPEAGKDEARKIPTATLSFILPSRYCEVDSELKLDVNADTSIKRPHVKPRALADGTVRQGGTFSP